MEDLGCCPSEVQSVTVKPKRRGRSSVVKIVGDL
jgi:hypothetical protein